MLTGCDTFCCCIGVCTILGETMTITALIAKFTRSMFEEAAGGRMNWYVTRATGGRCHHLTGTRVTSSPLHMSIPTVVPFTTSAILEVPKSITHLHFHVNNNE